MSLNAAKAPKGNGGSKFKPQEAIEAGTYPARVAQILDLGMQPQMPWQGQEKPPAHEIMITYELTDEFMIDEEGNEMEDKPRWISETMPLRHIDSDLAKSTKRYKALDPKMEHGGDFSQLLGEACNVLVTTYVSKKDGIERNKVQDVTAMRSRDSAKTEELKNEPKLFSLDEPDLTIFQSLPEWLQGKIKENLEYNGSALQELLEGDKPKGKGNPQAEEEGPVEEPTEGSDDTDEEEERPW
jgi:hypothetical protein